LRLNTIISHEGNNLEVSRRRDSAAIAAFAQTGSVDCPPTGQTAKGERDGLQSAEAREPFRELAQYAADEYEGHGHSEVGCNAESGGHFNNRRE
jgi:hypothetical protein